MAMIPEFVDAASARSCPGHVRMGDRSEQRWTYATEWGYGTPKANDAAPNCRFLNLFNQGLAQFLSCFSANMR